MDKAFIDECIKQMHTELETIMEELETIIKDSLIPQFSVLTLDNYVYIDSIDKKINSIILSLSLDFISIFKSISQIEYEGVSVRILCRSMFEILLNLLFICEDKNLYQNRALSYFYDKLERDKKCYDNIIKLIESEKVISQTQNSNENRKLKIQEEKISISRKAIDQIDAILKTGDFNEVINEVTVEKKKIKKTREFSWYNMFNGYENLKELADDFNLSMDYAIIYRGFSSSVHSMDQWDLHGIEGILHPNLYANMILRYLDICLVSDLLSKSKKCYSLDTKQRIINLRRILNGFMD